MRYSTRIKPISYLKANAADVLEELNEQGKVKSVADVVKRLRAQKLGADAF